MEQMLLQTLKIMGWLGIVLIILAMVNIVTKTLVNIWSGKEEFDKKKMIKGICKVVIFYACAVAAGIAFTILPFINNMITNTFGVVLLSNDLLNTFSSVGVLTVVISSIIAHAKKAINGIVELANVSTNTEEITWEVEENEE